MTQALKPQDPAARILADARKRRYLSPFLGRSRRLGEAASELGVSPARLAYWVKRFSALGLLVREGRGYRSSASAYFVPFSASTHADLAEWLEQELHEAHRKLLNAFGRLLDTGEYRGLLVFRDPAGAVVSALARGPEDRESLAPFGIAATIYLSQAEAEALTRELETLWARYRNRLDPAPGLQPYQVYAFLAKAF